jgi:ERCC4-type nuclease
VIYINTDEPKSVELYFREFQDVQLQRKKLDVGDYLVKVGDYEVAVERKEASDYVSSIEDGRLFNQLYQLSTNYELSFLIVVGSITEALIHSNLNRRAFLSSLVGSCMKRSPAGKRGQIITLTVETMHDFAGCVYYIHKKLEKGDFDRRPKPVGSKSDHYACLVTLYSCFPYVSEERAKRLAKRFPSLMAIVNASVEDLMQVEGIGKKIATEIYNFIHKYYRDTVTLDDVDDGARCPYCGAKFDFDTAAKMFDIELEKLLKELGDLDVGTV